MHDDVGVSRVIQVGLIGLALVIGAWFVLGWVQARDTGRAEALLSVSNTPTAVQAAQIGSLLNSAGRLNPDRTVDLLRARLAYDRHAYGKAVQILESVTNSEPQNISAWYQLAYTAAPARRIALIRRALGVTFGLMPLR
jgi:hypothetical protein